jgi:hypothetical protein
MRIDSVKAKSNNILGSIDAIKNLYQDENFGNAYLAITDDNREYLLVEYHEDPDIGISCIDSLLNQPQSLKDELNNIVGIQCYLKSERILVFDIKLPIFLAETFSSNVLTRDICEEIGKALALMHNFLESIEISAIQEISKKVQEKVVNTRYSSDLPNEFIEKLRSSSQQVILGNPSPRNIVISSDKVHNCLDFRYLHLGNIVVGACRRI